MKGFFSAVLILTLLFADFCMAEDEIKFYGMPSVAFNSGNSFLNFGGPNVKVESSSFFAGISFFPSLRSNSLANETTPLLGLGIFLGRDHLFLTAPFYYYSNSWYGAFGLGYKF